MRERVLLWVAWLGLRLERPAAEHLGEVPLALQEFRRDIQPWLQHVPPLVEKLSEKGHVVKVDLDEMDKIVVKEAAKCKGLTYKEKCLLVDAKVL